MKRGEAMDFEFTITLPEDMHDGITAKVAECITCNEQLDEAFDLDNRQPEAYK